MNFPVKLLKKEIAQEAGGNWGEPSETTYNLFAEVGKPSSAFRSYDAQTQLGEVKTFRLRFRFDLHPDGDWKIKFRNKEWTIVSIQPDQERQFYWIITANHK